MVADIFDDQYNVRRHRHATVIIDYMAKWRGDTVETMSDTQLTKGALKPSTGGRSSAAGTASPPPKLPPTTPLAVFERSIDRAQNLLTIHSMAHGSASRPPALLADIHRAAIVLAVSAMDAYIRTLVVNRVLAVLKDVTKPLPAKLREQLKELLGQDALLDAARASDLPARVEKALKDKFEDSSFQGVDKITGAMRLIGKDDIFKEVARAASTNEQELKEALGRFTKKRHIIAHCGDYDMSQTPPCENPIKKKDAEDCIKLMRSIAEKIDSIIKP